ncbi:hypothetical protein VB265_01920 [Enterobacter sichuanensis]|nr:hypothetical protein [Enterobacter sichuanensis]MEA5168303.1 hypothetical protein [Enterobacter sichuanensis]
MPRHKVPGRPLRGVRKAKPEVTLFVEWLDEEVAAWRQLTES